MTLQLATAGVNVLRDNHWVLNPVSGLYERSALLEGQRTNYQPRSESFASWTPVGTPTITPAAIPASVMGIPLDLIGDDDPAAVEVFTMGLTVVGDGVKGHTIYLKKGTGSPEVRLRDSVTSSVRLQFTVVWDAAGTPTVNYLVGSAWDAPREIASGVWRIRSLTTAVVAANVHSSLVYPAGTVSANTGDVYAGGVQVEDSFPSSYIATAAAAVSRSADSAYRDLPAAIATPQAMTMYARFIEMGSIVATASRVLFVGGASGAGPRLLIHSQANLYQVYHQNALGGASVVSTMAVGPSIGQLVELAATIAADGSVQMSQSINGGAVTTSVASGPLALAGAWSDTRLYVNSSGSSNTGFNAFLGKPNDPAVKLARGVKSMAQMRAF